LTPARFGRSSAILGYAETLAALESRGRFGIRLGLSRTRALLAGLGHPERSFRGALIAGTNGKGSVLALVGSALQAAGYRTGETPKPHLVTYRERLQVDGVPVDEETFSRLTGEVLALADRVARRHVDPTEFELLTAVTFLWFAEAGIDLAVVEVGLGGRLDATHAWDGGVAVVTNVALDHMAQLGSTVEAIAHEKAAIIMAGDRAVTGASGGALDVIERRSRQVHAPLTVTPPAPLRGLDRDGIDVELGRLGLVRVALRGRHQAANAAVADATLDALEVAEIARIPDDARRAGYASVRWPGRLELLDVAGREVLLDGAHNPAGAATLAEALDDLVPFLAPGRPTLVLAIMADKDVDGVLSAVAGSAMLAEARVICTAPPGGRALPPEQLAARWAAVVAQRGVATQRPAATGRGSGAASGRSADRSSDPAAGRAQSSAPEPIADPRAALDAALAPGTGDGPVIVAGSLYLVGAARAHLVDDPRLVPDPPLHAQERTAP
jgi:dihydrofolate synthase / folylpolyglutamate synthase